LTDTARKYQLVSALNALVVHGLTLDAPFLSVAATLHGQHRVYQPFLLRIHVFFWFRSQDSHDLLVVPLSAPCIEACKAAVQLSATPVNRVIVVWSSHLLVP
jgi:hypothetical protein